MHIYKKGGLNILEETKFRLTDGDYERLALKYRHALNNAMAEIQNIVDDFNNYGRKVVHTFCGRIKTKESLIEKCQRKNLGADAIEDIAGIRIVVLFEDDIAVIREAIEQVFFVKSLDDYLQAPKDNGYRGVHMTIIVSTIVNGKIKKLPVEIQIKTVLADALWSMEHVVKYKNNNPDPEAEQRVKEAAERVSQLEKDMIAFREYGNNNK